MYHFSVVISIYTYEKRKQIIRIILSYYFAQRMTTISFSISAPSINSGVSQPPASNASTLRDGSRAKTPSVPDLSRPNRTQAPSTILPMPATPLAREDIRLCTINRADATDTFGIELNYHRREQFHSLNLTSGRDNGPSSKKLFEIL